MRKLFDIIIVGDGILGYSTALSILEKSPELKLAIIGNQSLNAASIGAGAMLSCFAEVTHTTFSNKYSVTKFEMGRNALKKWPNWIINLNQYIDEKLEIKNGTYILLNAKSGILDTKNFLAVKQALQEYQEPYEEILSNEIPYINPIESCRPLQTIYLPNEGYINPVKLKNSLKEVLMSIFDVTFINAKVENIQYSNLAVKGVVLESNEIIFAEKVILATGAYTQTLINKIPEIRDKIPLTFAGVGYAALISSKNDVQNVIRTPNRAGACGLHVLPRDNTSLYIGATNNIYSSPQSSISLGLAQFLIKCAIEQIDQKFYQSEIKNWIVGNRPVTVDTFPLIGKTSIEGLIILSGTYRDGLHLSPYLSKYIADLVLNNHVIENLFTPERSFITTMTRQESIKEYLLHYQSGCYEHGMSLPLFMNENFFIDKFKNQVEDIYDELNIDFGLMPEILLMLILTDKNNEIIHLLKQYFERKN